MVFCSKRWDGLSIQCSWERIEKHYTNFWLENLNQRDLSQESVVGVRITLKLFWNTCDGKAETGSFFTLPVDRNNVFLRSFIFTNTRDVLSKVVASVHPNSYVFDSMWDEWPMAALNSCKRNRSKRFRIGFPLTAAFQLWFCSTLALCYSCGALSEMQIK